MNAIASSICETLGASAICMEYGPYVAVSTHCLYPSNKAVTVYISGGARECVVSDNGGAIDELTTAGLTVGGRDGIFRQMKSICKDRGLHIQRAKIVSPPVPLEAVPTALVMVANAARDVAIWGMQNIRPRRKRDMKAVISNTLAKYFSPERIMAEEQVTGASTRRYRIDWVVRLSDRARLLVDSVLPEPASINAKAVAHMDIHRLAADSANNESPMFNSCLAYDPDDEWKSSDLSLLQMAGKLVALPTLSKALKQISLN